MEIELVEIRDFLAQRPPFDALPEERLNQLPRMLEIRYLRRNREFPPVDAGDSYLYILRSGAVDLLDAQDHLIEKLDEGDLYTVPCQLVDVGRATHGVATEDTLLYLLPCLKLHELRSGEPEFNRHFSESMRERLRQALDRVQEASDPVSMAQLAQEVGSLLNKAPVKVAADTSIRDAARTMTEQNVSSIMLMEQQQLVGILTDRDLRSRCVAQGISPDLPARSIMTAHPQTIRRDGLLLDALMSMTRLNVHHLPVLDGQQVVGMLTASDLARLQSANSAFIAADIRKSGTLEELIGACRRLPELQYQLANSGVSAGHIGEAISNITDSLTLRLIEMAETELGPPSVPYVWLCGGSQARAEQSSHSDQDNALLISDQLQPEQEPWFAALAERVCAGLDACGFVYCPGEAMARNPQWRQPLRVWRRYFDNWIDKPEPMALMLSSIFFDLRPVHGEPALFEALQQEILAKTRGNGIFTAYLVANALQFRPPLGFFRTFVLIHGGEHDDTFDIKHRGIVPITDIARILALSQGLPQVNTDDRLQAAAAAQALSTEMAENLRDALELIAGLRIRHQAGQIRLGLKADNYLPPDDLSELERKHLKDAFRVIQEMQHTLENRYQSGRFR
ncbi:MAG: putative nucleotidyltransferase substrate binding domain-containing protein [Chromatiales bacterium]|jgi:CBS domain-containing protein